MIYVHPILGVLAVVLTYWSALLGFQSRQRGRHALRARATHRKVTPLTLAVVLVSAAWGTTSVVILRPELQLAESPHFAVGWLAALLATATWLLSRAIHSRPWAKKVHPWVGLAGLAAVTLEAGLGLDMLP